MYMFCFSYADPDGQTGQNVNVALPYHLPEIMETEDIRRLKKRVILEVLEGVFS